MACYYQKFEKDCINIDSHKFVVYYTLIAQLLATASAVYTQNISVHTQPVCIHQNHTHHWKAGEWQRLHLFIPPIFSPKEWLTHLVTPHQLEDLVYYVLNLLEMSSNIAEVPIQ